MARGRTFRDFGSDVGFLESPSCVRTAPANPSRSIIGAVRSILDHGADNNMIAEDSQQRIAAEAIASVPVMDETKCAQGSIKTTSEQCYHCAGIHQY